MKIVVDTNIFVSAALKESSWPSMVIRWLDKHGGLLKSLVTEQELFAVLERPRIAAKIQPVFLDNLRLIFVATESVLITEHITICRDAKDDKFLELALNGRADIIVSGDQDLLTLNPFQGIPIVQPATFIRLMTEL
jgi:putative PIN family toxin of toxin-antitoxin system